ncbi:MAG: sigma-70 family RNA polymerase sigma factor [Pseudonocardiales bacterium]|nr:sigma-70 family RNA polymerase sigma factor [Pseudonocardiales bacterium]
MSPGAVRQPASASRPEPPAPRFEHYGPSFDAPSVDRAAGRTDLPELPLPLPRPNDSNPGIGPVGAEPARVEQPGEGVWVLVKATQAGDMDAFARLYDRYHEVVFRYVLFRINDRGVAEDVTHETFVRALRRIATVSYQGRDIGAWFITIARNLVLDHVKSSRYRLEKTTSEIADFSPATCGPEQQVVDGATHDELLRCVAKLNPDQQECIALRFLQGLSVAETARLMGRNEGAVKALQHRAVRRLGQLLPEGLR